MCASKINNPVMLRSHEKQKENEITVKALKLVPIKDQCQSSNLTGLSIVTMNKPNHSDKESIWP